MSGAASVLRSLADRLLALLAFAELEPVPLADRGAAKAPSFERASRGPDREPVNRELDEREREIIILTAAWM